MVRFERRDPFPKLDLGTLTKSEAKAHSVEVDRFLGLRVNDIEARLNLEGSKTPAPHASRDHQQLWFGLDPQDLLTPYLEIRSVLETLSLRGRHHVVDLGAAYGRMGFVIERHFPDLTFAGYEYVGERVKEASLALLRFGASRSRVEHADLTSPKFQLPIADVYFIYDYGTPKAIEKTLHDLRRVACMREILIVARGELVATRLKVVMGGWVKEMRQHQKARSQSIVHFSAHLSSSTGSNLRWSTVYK